MAKKYYAIKSGVDPETGENVNDLILDSWIIAKEYVTGIAGAVYKSFKIEENAKNYLFENDKPLKIDEQNKRISEPQKKVSAIYEGSCPSTGKSYENIWCCYVDGSFNSKLENYGAGLIVVENNIVLFADSFPGNNKEAVSMQQIGGELLGAIQACLYAKRNNVKHLIIFHDYMGVQYHVTGVWKPKNHFSKIYKKWMTDFKKDNPGMTIEFEHVKAHAGNKYNELADGYAKISVGIEPEPAFYKLKELFIN